MNELLAVSRSIIDEGVRMLHRLDWLSVCVTAILPQTGPLSAALLAHLVV